MTNDKQQLFDDIADIIQEELADLGTSRLSSSILLRDYSNAAAKSIIDQIELLFDRSIIRLEYNRE